LSTVSGILSDDLGVDSRSITFEHRCAHSATGQFGQDLHVSVGATQACGTDREPARACLERYDRRQRSGRDGRAIQCAIDHRDALPCSLSTQLDPDGSQPTFSRRR